jgi:hypothetical protein
MTNRHQELESVVVAYLENWEAEFRDFQAKSEAEGAELRRQQEQARDEFDALAPVEIGIKFRKRSPRLLALRLKEARQALVREFPGAQKTKLMADRAEKAEVAKAFEETRRDFLFRRANLVREQEETLNAFLVHIEGIRQAMVMKRDRRVSGFLRRMSGLNHDLGNTLNVLKTTQAEICDPEPDQERAEFAVDTEFDMPIPEFRTAVMSLARKQRRRRTAAKSARTEEGVQE